MHLRATNRGHTWVLFHTERTTKSAGSGCDTDDKASFSTKRTIMRVNTSGNNCFKISLLTGTVDPRNKVEPVEWHVCCGIHEVADSA